MALDDLLPFLIPVLSAGVGWMIGKKKNDAQARKIDAETDMLEIKNVQKVIEFWQETAKDLTAEVTKLRNEVLAFAEENKELKEEIAQLSLKIVELQKIIGTENLK